MKVVALISGGKDSCYNIMQCVAAGHKIEALANLSPNEVDELDSYMYQTVGHSGIAMYSEALQVPLFRGLINGKSLRTESLDYIPTEGDEVEDLYDLLKIIKDERSIEAVSVGAVLSDFQRIRVENVCQRLGLISLAYLWRRDQSELLKEMIKSDVKSIIIKVAAIGLTPKKHLGLTIKEIQPHLENLKDKYGVHVCGEGGEYETFTLDCPLFIKKIVLEDSEIVETGGDVGYLRLKSLRLVDKDSFICSPLIRKPYDFLTDLRLKDEEQQFENEAKEISLSRPDSCGELQNKNFVESDFSVDSEILSLTRCDGCSRNDFFWVSVWGNSVAEVMEKIKQTLSAKSMLMSNIISLRMFVKDMKKYSEYNSEYSIYFLNNPPTRACVQVYMDNIFEVCIDIVAWKDPSREESPSHIRARTTMHVQSISHWAPANIAPYSQGIKVGSLIMVAGMIGLIPGSMELLSGSAELQARLTLRHIDRVLTAIAPKASVRSVVQGICYVTDISYIGVARRMMARVSEAQISAYVVVSALPKNALVEWHTWAHLDNEKFDYEERGYTIDKVGIKIIRRYSPDNSVSVSIASLSASEFSIVTEDCLNEMFLHILDNKYRVDDFGQIKDNSSPKFIPTHLTLFYKVNSINLSRLSSILSKFDGLSKSIIPALAIEDDKTLMSVVLTQY